MKKLTVLLCSLVILTVFSACEENTGSSELSETTSVTTVQTKVTTEKITTQISTEPPITNYTEVDQCQ